MEHSAPSMASGKATSVRLLSITYTHTQDSFLLYVVSLFVLYTVPYFLLQILRILFDTFY